MFGGLKGSAEGFGRLKGLARGFSRLKGSVDARGPSSIGKEMFATEGKSVGTAAWLQEVNADWGRLDVYPEEKAGLVVVDVQNDFCPGGALGVPGGDEVVPVLNRWIRRFAGLGLPIAFTLDWHPAGHCSFREQGGIWPAHCVQDETGSSLRPDLELPAGCRCADGAVPSTPWAVFKKGFLSDCEAYSGFDGRLDGTGEGPTLGEWLKGQGVERIYIGGLATDYCVKATVEDGLKRGFGVTIIKEGMRAVDVNPGDGERAIEEMLRAGARIAPDPGDNPGDNPGDKLDS